MCTKSLPTPEVPEHARDARGADVQGSPPELTRTRKTSRVYVTREVVGACTGVTVVAVDGSALAVVVRQVWSERGACVASTIGLVGVHVGDAFGRLIAV